MYYNNGESYQGEFLNNQKQSKGVYQFISSDKYEGIQFYYIIIKCSE